MDNHVSKVLVTGLTGRVGANLAVALVNRGYQVKGIVMPGDPTANKLDMLDGVEVAYASLTDHDAIAEASEDVDYVVHLAAVMVRGNSPSEALFNVNVFGTLRLLEAAVRGSRSVKRFVLASTDGTYDSINPDYLPIDEQHPQLPGDEYGTSKVLAEQLVKNYGKQWNLPYCIVRFSTVLATDEILNWFRYEGTIRRLRIAEKKQESNVWPLYANVERPWKYVEKAVTDEAGDPAVGLIDEDGNPWGMPLTDVRDIVSGTILALEHSAAEGETFNIGPPETTEYETAARHLAEVLELPVHIVPMPLRWYYTVSIAKAKRVLGYEPQWTYHKMLESALAYRRGEDIGVVPARIAE